MAVQTPRYWCSFCHREVAQFCTDDDASIVACQARQAQRPLDAPRMPDPAGGLWRTLGLGLVVLGALGSVCGLLWALAVRTGGTP